jgi:hypothetical protein
MCNGNYFIALFGTGGDSFFYQYYGDIPKSKKFNCTADVYRIDVACSQL